MPDPSHKVSAEQRPTGIIEHHPSFAEPIRISPIRALALRRAGARLHWAGLRNGSRIACGREIHSVAVNGGGATGFDSARTNPATRVNFIAEMNRTARRLGLMQTLYRLPYGDGGTSDDPRRWHARYA